MGEKGLGKGLGALFGEAALATERVDCVYLPITDVEAGLTQPRHVFDEDGLAELADSISEHGIIQPLTVRKLPTGYYQIIAGERRWRAARMAGLDKVPVRIIEADDSKAMELALVENLQREDLNPVEEALGYRTLIDEYGLTQEKAAQRVGKSRPAVANALRLLELPQEVLNLLEIGALSAGHCRALLALEQEHDILACASEIQKKSLSVRETEAMVKSLLQGGKGKKELTEKEREKLFYVHELEQKLTTDLGRRVRITDGRKKGKLELEYYGNDDLELILKALEGLGRKNHD